MSNNKNNAATASRQHGGNKQLDLYSYTGKVKFFDKDKGFGYIQEIADVKNPDNVINEWRITSEQLGNTVIHRGEFVYFMKQGKTIGEITPLNLRDLLKAPCPKCGRRDYVPGRNSVCELCGHQFEFTADPSNVTDSRDRDPAFNCLAGTDEDIPCPTCGRHAWKRYGYYQSIRCRCCGTIKHTVQQNQFLESFIKTFLIVISSLIILIIIIACYFFLRFYKF